MNNLAVFCADVGSIKNNKFGWAAKLPDEPAMKKGAGIHEFAALISSSLEKGLKVSIGFECPLFVPVREDAVSVNSARNGEGNRSWSAGAGTGALATGIVEVLWILNQVAKLTGRTYQAEMSWDKFLLTDTVHFWEAFVSSTSKGTDHTDDAAKAVEAFVTALPSLSEANAITEKNVLSLVGAAALRSGWSSNLAILAEPCLVIKA